MVMSRILILLVLLISCRVGYEKLTGQRQSYVGSEIKTNGYYYCIDTVTGGSVDKPKKEVVARIYFFYRNGVVHHSNMIFSDLKRLEATFKDSIFMARFKERPYGWGIYSIENDRIEIESWSTSTGGKHPNFKYNLDIVSDSVLHYSYRHNTFLYRRFDLKPDSVNRFIE